MRRSEEGERGRFLVLLRTVHGGRRGDSWRHEEEEKALCEDGIVLFEAGRLQLEGGWGRSLLAPTRDSCSQHFALRRLQFP